MESHSSIFVTKTLNEVMTEMIEKQKSKGTCASWIQNEVIFHSEAEYYSNKNTEFEDLRPKFEFQLRHL